MADAAGNEWNEYRLRDLFGGVKAGAWGDLPRNESDPLCVRVADFDRQWLRVRSSVPTRRYVGTRTFERIALQKGDLLLEKSGGGDKQPVGTVVVWNSDEDAICSNFVARLRVKPGVSPRFICLALHASYVTGSVRRNIKQTTGIQNLDMRGFFSESVTIPSFATQELIVRYLDNADLRIARAIQTKIEMRDLIEEREQQYLMRAIVGDSEMLVADDRVDWLTGIPAHWEVKRLGSVLRERAEQNAPIKVTQVLSLLRKRGVLLYEDKGNIGNKKSDDISRYKVVRPGDIVVNCMNVIIGSVGLSRYEGCLSPVYYVLTTRSQDDSTEFFDALFQVERFHKALVRFGKGILAHRMRISMLDLKTVPLPVPPPEEQKAIVERVRDSRQATRAAIESIESEIALLREYRTRLISDVVTGKKDVRAEAASMKDIDPTELSAALAGGTPSDDTDVEVNDDVE